jgi:hypothetical protein
MGMVSGNEPESALKAPPCRLMRTLSRLLLDKLDGLTMRTGTPTRAESVMGLGQIFLQAAFARTAHAFI